MGLFSKKVPQTPAEKKAAEKRGRDAEHARNRAAAKAAQDYEVLIAQQARNRRR